MTSTAKTADPTFNPAVARRAVTVFSAVAAAALTWAIAVPLLNTDLTLTIGDQSPSTVGIGPVIVTSLVATLAGWASLTALERFSSHARAIWTAVATTALLVSFAPLVAAEATTAAKATLALLHVVVATVLIPGLTRQPTAHSVRGPR